METEATLMGPEATRESVQKAYFVNSLAKAECDKVLTRLHFQEVTDRTAIEYGITYIFYAREFARAKHFQEVGLEKSEAEKTRMTQAWFEKRRVFNRVIKDAKEGRFKELKYKLRSDADELRLSEDPNEVDLADSLHMISESIAQTAEPYSINQKRQVRPGRNPALILQYGMQQQQIRSKN